MKVLIDADACPVTKSSIRLCREFQVSCTLFCDTAHEFYHDGVTTLIVDKGADSADFAIANQALPGDLVITQDYGLASMCLARGARVLHQDGWEYTLDNIDALLFSRHESRKYRASGGRIKGPKKRTSEQDRAFEQALCQILSSK
jgi:uncharacterized protein YaiI (UPF0178 family)